MTDHRDARRKFYPILSIVRAQRAALVESSTALAIARLLIAEIQGQEQLNFYEPLTVIEETDQWVVQGVAADPRYRGMTALAKADCQIVGLDFEMPMEPLEEAD